MIINSAKRRHRRHSGLGIPRHIDSIDSQSTAALFPKCGRPGHDAGRTGFQQGTDNYATPARQYSGSIARWLSPDPAGLNAVQLTDPQTWNMYVYVRNNPATRIDPTGLGDCAANNGTTCNQADGRTQSPSDESEKDMAQNEWSLSWQVSASASSLGEERVARTCFTRSAAFHLEHAQKPQTSRSEVCATRSKLSSIRSSPKVARNCRRKRSESNSRARR